MPFCLLHSIWNATPITSSSSRCVSFDRDVEKCEYEALLFASIERIIYGAFVRTLHNYSDVSSRHFVETLHLLIVNVL